LLGTELPTGEIRALLTPLGLETEQVETEGGGDDAFTAVAPTYRPDLEREIDIVEEVARRVGLQNIARTVPSNPAKIGALTPAQRERRAIADVLVGAGYDEAFALPLLAPTDLTRAGCSVDGVIEVENPLRAEESLLRPGLLPGLLRAAAFNAAHGTPSVALFESGSVFAPAAPGETLPTERVHVAVVRTGAIRRAPHEPDRVAVPADAVALIAAIAEELRLADWRLVATDDAPGFHPVRTAAVLIDDERAGVVGEVAPDVIDALELAAPVVAFELDLGALHGAARISRASRAVSRFPMSSIDLAFVVDDAVPAGDVLATLQETAGDLAEWVELFDVFRSDALGEGRVSLAFKISFRAPDRTLTDDEVAGLRQQLIDAVVGAHRAELRG
jgi:phenylalanyl-tRNA synthetase beta chain